MTTTCVEGAAIFTPKLPFSIKIGTVPIKVMIKDKGGNYIKDATGKELLLEKDITIDEKSTNTITNTTIATINRTDTTVKSEMNGAIDLESLKFVTDILIVNDTFSFDTSYSNIWVLVDDSEKTLTNYKHWKKERLIEDQNLKPKNLPVSFIANTDITVNAFFKCNVDIIGAEVRITSSEPSCVFSTDPAGRPNKGSMLFELKFKATTPFKTIRCIPNFELTFEYKTASSTTWLPLVKMEFCLYITKNKPIRNLNASAFLPESLFDIGCRQCEGKNETDIDTDEKVIDLIFAEFEKSKLKVLRARESKNTRPNGVDKYIFNDNINGIGYWRGTRDIPRPDTTYSPLLPAFAHPWKDISPEEYVLAADIPQSETSVLLSIRRHFRKDSSRWQYVLATGEGRCGPITNLFIEILKVQGIAVDEETDTVGICTDCGYKERKLRKRYTKQYPKKRKKKKFKSAYFAVKDAIHADEKDPRVVINRSKALGNDNANPVFYDHFWFYHNQTGRFFDPSYGCKYSKLESKFVTYCKENITSMLVETKKKPNEDTNIAPLTDELILEDPKILYNDVTKKQYDYLHHYISSDKDLFE